MCVCVCGDGRRTVGGSLVDTILTLATSYVQICAKRPQCAGTACCYCAVPVREQGIVFASRTMIVFRSKSK
ncbi:MAG TPA: hypothetical protein VHV10_11645, partial [Ktedonobacteraceae bacterium]|nr:hypothetical protein [Ktedonobacteraceae bacterium]